MDVFYAGVLCTLIASLAPEQMLTNLFRYVLMISMQFNKASKKTRTIAEESKASAPETSAAAEVAANPRATRSSKTKKTEPTETGSVKHRHNKGNVPSAPDTAPAQRANGKAAGSFIVDPVGVAAPTPEKEPAANNESRLAHREVAHEEIAKLAYSYWIARGCSHGSAEEDWLRAERELRQGS
jgi:Protein of unknown function (DUF2934)